MINAFDKSNILTLGILAVVALIGLVVTVLVLSGLFKARSLLRREFSAYFLSPIAYVVLVIFLAVTGHLFYLTLTQLTASGTPAWVAWSSKAATMWVRSVDSSSPRLTK